MRSRIIPARAGFTGDGPGAPAQSPDHPRSRGVYIPASWVMVPPVGSSPLARGLRCESEILGGMAGIIPARAGFTAGGRRGGAGGPDHPRSRGVYTVGPAAFKPPVGIIPARAGFTSGSSSAPPSTKDHPRSRGVYFWVSQATTDSTGSSPLARGLLAGLVGGLGVPGIIPARAGFTAPGRAPWAAPADHPRSRGVYCPVLGGGPGQEGSSPLARGLRAVGVGDEVAGGIIPARAGFTVAADEGLAQD